MQGLEQVRAPCENDEKLRSCYAAPRDSLYRVDHVPGRGPDTQDSLPALARGPACNWARGGVRLVARNERPVDGWDEAQGDWEFAIEVEGLWKSYAGRPVLRNLSFQVPPGTVFGLVGAGGAGKTTAVRIVAGLQRPDVGTARVVGIDVRQTPAAVRDRVGYMPQSFGSYGRLTAAEYLDFYAASQGLTLPERQLLCDDLLELVDLSERRGEPVDALLPGMKKRLGLARCLIHDPAVLLLDEPAAGLDLRGRAELREIVLELANLDKTVLLTAASLAPVAEICTHVAMLQDGEVAAQGTIGNFTSAPSSLSRLRLRLPSQENLAAAMELLTESPLCSAVLAEGERDLGAEFAGTQQDLASLLSRLGAEGISVMAFTLEEDRLWGGLPE